MIAISRDRYVRTMDLEICVDSVESAVAAEAGGAQRVELCSGLIEGGLTPSLGLVHAVRSRIGIAMRVMIRPRGGDFLYSDEEVAVMRDDILHITQSGADGVVLGLLTADGDVDVQRTRQLVEIAGPMGVTFHRAIDMTRDLEQAIEDVIASGVDRVLTSGGEPTAMRGTSTIRKLVLAARGKIRVMAGGGVRAENVQEIARATGAVEFHAALRSTIPSPIRHRVQDIHLGDPGIDDYARNVVWSADVRMLREAMDAVLNGDRSAT
jgi:copper homeostasis protein